MILSRKWANDYVDLTDIDNKTFCDEMTLSGSKVELTHDLGEEISNVVVGKVLSMERHPDSDHMWICQLDVGQSAPIQIVTGAWNIHPGDMVPVALDHSTLPGGKKIEKGKLRGVESNGMMCGLYELGLDERDFPYAAIVPAAILNDYHSLDKDKPSIPADIQPGDKVFGPVVCAKILECASQPDYTFHTCLDLGGSTAVPDTICPNLHEGDLVAYNTKTGTICTLEDLHADQKEFPHCIPDGIFVLHEEGIQNGDDIKLIIGADDHVVEFEITPNRPDCLSVIGLAREVAATYQQPLTLHEPEVQGGADGVLTDLLDIETPAADLVPRYTARMVRNVKIAPSPKWMRERLRSMGVRPINNIVDITNYVMLEYGQPMHAFDLRSIDEGKIRVRRAKNGEKITTLDGTNHVLTDNQLVIADAGKPVAIAGVMGGEYSGIVDDTTTIVFESANFLGSSVRITARDQGMRTDASSRYEKGLDPNNCIPALNRACELVELLDAGDVMDGIIMDDHSKAQPRKIPLEADWINRFLDLSLSEEEMRAILSKLGCQFDGDLVIIPTYRPDLVHKADIAEEIARFYGYNKIPSTSIRGGAQGKYSARQKFDQTISRTMLAAGLSEIMTYSFVSPKVYDKILVPADSPLRKSVVISNPLGEDTSIMRTTALPSMLEILQRNYNNRNASAHLFEIAREYIPTAENELPVEKNKLICGFYGGDGLDFFTVKGIVEALFDQISLYNWDIEAVRDQFAFHPGQCAKLSAGDDVLGYFGQIHPKVAENYGIDEKVYAVTLDVDLLFTHASPEKQYHPLPKFPAVTRDLALLCEESIPVLTLEKTIQSACGQILESIKLFDVYQGKQIAAGQKSVAFNITLRSADSTLGEEQVNAAMKRIMKALEKMDVKLRT